MHIGLKSTLTTVAVALLGLKAMAMAPTIGQLPDVYIGDGETATGGATVANNFVFPDAVNVNTYVNDDNTTDGGLLISFSNPGGHYSINDRTSTDMSDIHNPSAAHSIDGGDDSDSVDANRRSLTFRSIFYSPLPHPGGGYADPGTPDGVPSDGQAISLVASDGTSYTTSQPFMAYIVNNGEDALSGGLAPSVEVFNVDFGTGTNGWTPVTVIPGAAVTMS